MQSGTSIPVARSGRLDPDSRRWLERLDPQSPQRAVAIRELHALLLRAARFELSCEQCFEQLDRCVELELAGRDADAEVVGMRAHLEGCPACAEDHASLLALVRAEQA